MANIVVLGAGLGGTLAAYEVAAQVRREDTVTLIGEGTNFEFVPSNPWVAVGWRTGGNVRVDLTRAMQRRKIRFLANGAVRVHPAENRVELRSGESVSYDYLVIATGPELAFDEVPGLGPTAHTHSICQTAHAEQAHEAVERLAKSPGPVVVGAVQGASCFGPAYEFAFILDTSLRKRRVRDRVPISFVTSEPYVGHLGLDGVGGTKGLLESEFRQRHIKWITNARVKQISAGSMRVEEVAGDGSVYATHVLPFQFAMMLPAFRGVEALRGIEGLVNPRGFVLVDEYQRNPRFPNVFAIGVCVAIPPVSMTSVPVGVPKTGFMIESMVTASAMNIGALQRNEPVRARFTWNAVCLADFGDGGVAFVAQPQIPPRNVSWASRGTWVHMAKAGFERYFLRKIRAGESEPFNETFVLKQLNIAKLKAPVLEPGGAGV